VDLTGIEPATSRVRFDAAQPETSLPAAILASVVLEEGRSATSKSAMGHEVGPLGQPQDAAASGALESALVLAAQAGRWDVVAQLARELEARRLAGSNVVALDGKRRDGER
jgi:hypothetical protein